MEIIILIVFGTIMFIQLHENIKLREQLKKCETAYKEICDSYNKLKNPL
jgi:hypothetical protein